MAALPGGYSRGVFRVVVAGPAEAYVLRVHRRGAEACVVESALAHRLRGVVPVPEIVYADPAGEVIGAPVTLARWVQGERLEDVLPRCDVVDAIEVGHAVGLTLARIGTVRFERGGFFADDCLTVNGMPGTPAQQLVTYVRERLSRPVPGMDDDLRRRYVDLVAEAAPLTNRVDGACQLVHSDYNPKNLLVSRDFGRWRVTSVLDWEFAFAGSPLFDVANMLRFPTELPDGYIDGFMAGFRDGGGELAAGWEEVARTLDVFSLCDFLAANPPGPMTARARAIAKRCVSAGCIWPVTT